MNFKDYIIIILLIVIIIVLFKVLNQTKGVTPPTQVQDAPENSEQDEQHENPEQVIIKKRNRKSVLKIKYNRVVKILKELDVPMTKDAILEIYNQSYKAISKSTLSLFLLWLSKNKFISSEEIDGKGKIFGIFDWFNEEGQLEEDYFLKLKKQKQ